MTSVSVLLKVRPFITLRFSSIVHPRPRINLDINFGDKIGGRITVEVSAFKRF